MLYIPTEAERIIEAARARAARRMDGPEFPAPKKKRAHGKRHSVNKERSFEDRMEAARQGRAQEAANERRRIVRETIRAYFRGEIADLSAIAHLIGAKR